MINHSLIVILGTELNLILSKFCDKTRVTMDCLIQNWIIFIILMCINSVTGSIKSPCPLACDCDLEKGVVDCKYGAWNKLPNIPAGTKHIKMARSYFEKFSGPYSCQNYSEVTDLELYLTSTSIAEDILQCMPKLHSLTIEVVSLIIPYIYTEPAFDILYVDLLPRLCAVRNLERADVQFKYMDKGTKHPVPSCFGSLEHLSDIRLNFPWMNYNGTTQALQPPRNVSNSISLRSCGIEQVENDTFFMFQARILDLSYNPIYEITAQTFQHMPNLIELNLEGSDMISLYQLLMELNSLQVLSLSMSYISDIPYLPSNIHKFKLNSYRKYKLKRGAFLDLKNLEELDLSRREPTRTGIDFIERSAFYNLPKLKILKLGNNCFERSSLSNLLLDVAHCPLKFLDLSGNQLHTLNKTFQALNQIERLYLSRCKIKKMAEDEFKNMRYLQELDLSQNQITWLPSNIFQNLTNLTTVTLHHNRLYFATRAFGPDIPLKHLDLSNNLIESVEIINIPTLLDIDLSHNEISNDKFVKLKNLMSLRHLNLSSNHMTSNQNDFYHLSLPNLLGLDLSDNPVILPEFYRGFQGLKSLKLSNVPIGYHKYFNEPINSKIPTDFWDNKTHLKSLYINGCQIKTLTPGMFNSSNQLQILDVSSNEIALVHSSAFQGVPMLKELYLHDNYLTNVNYESFEYLPHLRLLTLANNPILCTCEVLWIFQAVTTFNFVYIHNQDQLVCKGPARNENIKVKELDMTMADCESPWVKILSPVAGFIGSFLVFMILYKVWRNRWHIRYTLFLAKAGLGRYQEFIDETEYKYDAFLAYSGEDLSWVKKHLLPNVDMNNIGQQGFKLCLHHRDWLGGIDIAENIVKSLTESRRTIIVLSKNFAKSQWCQYELAMAHLKASAEEIRKDRLLVILLDNIPSELLTPRLVYILSTKTYLTWPQDPDEQQLFWKIVRKSLKKELLHKTTV